MYSSCLPLLRIPITVADSGVRPFKVVNPSGKESVQMRVLIINWDLSALDKFQWSSMKKNLGFNGVTYIENPF